MRKPPFQGTCRGWLAVLACLLIPATAVQAGDVVFVNDFQHAPGGRGGSNYHWYGLGNDCDREPYGILANYHRAGVRPIVLDQLVQMRARGQDRIAAGVIHLRAPAPNDGSYGGTLLDSTGGNLRPQFRQNLALFLADVRDAGFAELLFRYFPQGANNPMLWTQFDESLYQENWNLIHNLEPLLQQSGLNYLVDLGVELMPRARIIDIPGYPVIRPNEPAHAALSEYTRRLWREYVHVFGHQNSIGFSMIASSNNTNAEARVRHMPYVYTGQYTAGVYPVAIALDIYGTPTHSEATIFVRHDQHMRRFSELDGTPWIVSEAFYDDGVTASGLTGAMNDSGRTVRYLTQWPLQRNNGCGDGVNVALPEHFGNYQLHGF